MNREIFIDFIPIYRRGKTAFKFLRIIQLELGSVYMEKVASAVRGYFQSRDIGILYKLMKCLLCVYMSITNSITQVRLFSTADISAERSDISA